MVEQWLLESIYSARETAHIVLAPPPVQYQEPDQVERSQILARIDAGNDQFRHRAYGRAVDEYLAARVLILRLIKFTIRPEMILKPGFQFPVDPELLMPMLESALEHVRLGQSLEPLSPFIGPRFHLVPEEVHRELDKVATLAAPGPTLPSLAAAEKVARAYLRIDEPEQAATALMSWNEMTQARENPDLWADVTLRLASVFQRVGDAGRVEEFVGEGREAVERAGSGQAKDIDELESMVLELHTAAQPVAATPGSQADERRVQPDRTANTFEVKLADGKVAFRLGQPETVREIIDSLYAPRSGVVTLEGLKVRPEILGNLAAFTPHYYYFVLPVCLGDAYHQLGLYGLALAEYRTAAGYQFLNQPIEAPRLWMKMAKSHLAWGDALYRQDDRTQARAQYENVLQGGEPPAASPLYRQGLTVMTDRVREVLANRTQLLDTDPRTAGEQSLSPLLASILLDVEQRLAQLDGDLNVFGFAEDYVPTMSFEFLQGVARSFAQFAAQANREYITFRRRAEDESYTMLKLEQAAELSRIGWQIERERLTAAQREQAAAAAAEEVTELRTQLARDNLENFEDLGWEDVLLQEAAAWAGATAEPYSDQIELRYGGLQHLGIQNRYQPRSKLVKELARARAERSYEIEQGRLANAVAELEASEPVARRQRQAAEARTRAAALSVDAAKTRYMHSLAEVEFNRNREIDGELYDEFADLVRETAELYLRRAIEVAFLMERAYEFQYGVEVNRIRFDYGDIDVADGLYAADLLLQDIDFFTLDKILSARAKPQPASHVFSLATNHPLEFLGLRRTGSMRFSTHLADFQADHPGLFNGRIKRVEVMVEGLVGSTGPVGSISCGGVSRFRRQDGAIAQKVHAPETMLLSDFRPRRDALLAEVPSEILQVFENVGLGTDWFLTFPKHRNDFDFTDLTDVRLVISSLAEHDPDLEATDIAALPAEEDGQIWYSLRFDMVPDAFFLLADDGRLDFALAVANLPRNHLDPRIAGVALMAVGTNGTLRPVHLHLWSDESGSEADEFSSGPNGVVLVHAPGATDGMAGSPVVTGWHLVIDPEQNPDLRPPAGRPGALHMELLQDLILVFQYRYTRP